MVLTCVVCLRCGLAAKDSVADVRMGGRTCLVSAKSVLGIDEVSGAAQGDEAHGEGSGWGGFCHSFIVTRIAFCYHGDFQMSIMRQ
jgi:hypothetical protein